MKIFGLILLNIFIFCNNSYEVTAISRRILIIIVVDGFREDYFNIGVTPNLEKFRENCVNAKSLKTLIFSNALQSLHTIATGYYSGKHGVIGHRFFSRVPGGRETTEYSEKLYNFDKTIMPIWIENQLNCGVSGCIMWPGCEFKYADQSVNYLEKYNSSVPIIKRYETIVKWLNETISPNLIMVYIDEPDRQGHTYGPNSQQVAKYVADIDEAHGYLNEKLKKLMLLNKVDVIYFSEHGMEEVSRFKNKMDICPRYQDESILYFVNAVEMEIISFTTPNSCPYDPIFKNKFNRTRRVQQPFRETNDIVEQNSIIVLKPGEAWEEYMKEKEYSTKGTNKYGAHGYIEFEDRTILMAQGRSFRKGLVSTPMEQVDLYSLFTHLLKIPAKDKRDGNFSRVRSLLKLSENEMVNWSNILIMIPILAILSSVIFYFAGNRYKSIPMELKLKLKK